MHLLNTPLKLTISSIALIVLIGACNSNNTSTQKENIDQVRNQEMDDMIQRGAYLVTAGSCNDCHTPKKMTPQGPVDDSSRTLSGHPANSPLPPIDTKALQPGNWILFAPDLTAFVGPWGISYTANLTPDSATGTGAWTEDVFIKALRTGKHLGQENGRPILPPMPWPSFGKLTDDDLKAIFAYLRSLPPISNRVPAPISPQDAAKMATNNNAPVAEKMQR
ncbi:MAG: cytochrome c [Bacteroidota bacterium]|nr:c-type cytochrome [Flavisolibacter sp.]MBD0297163.1 c-type cytochrome [Flavisolibacter sp.]MBD0366357.1 c-type cytochrome [Flavisolibacter sp.]MDQ3845164.1 cytochrome c [Bacteroidota bacterium]